MMPVAATRNTVAMSIFRVRYRTTSTPGTRSQSIAGVAAHQVAMFRPVRPVRKAPTAAGLKMCRPRNASAYLETLANTHASATPAMSVAPNAGQNRKYSSSPVMREDSECGLTRNTKASKRLDKYVSPTQRTRCTSISGMPNVSQPSTFRTML